MEIKVTEDQYQEFCKKPDCVKELSSLLNNPTTKNIFRRPIDNALDRHKMLLPKTSKQYKDDSEILRKFFKFSEDKIEELMNIKMMYDDDGNWMPINKLNTNYSDLSVLVSDILVDEDFCTCAVVEQLKNNNTEILSELVKRINDDPEKYYQKYLKGNYDKYTQNNRVNTIRGNESELFAVKELEKQGFKLEYLAAEGSPIDTKLGVDLIMSKNDKFYSFQVKSVGSISKMEKTPCDISNPGIKKEGGYKVFKRNRISVNENNVNFLIFVTTNNRMIVMKKYQPVSIESIRPLACVAKPIMEFPKNNTYIDLESVVYSNLK